ncbi:MAG: fused MFS/spermidine synthase [Steroidobacteraceae bacterium]|nr:fused MFS/spermidine synthase [Steroidobacteraceae bacterium]
MNRDDGPILVERDGRRALVFTIDGSVQSEMRLDDPVALVNEYTRKMMAFLLFCPRPRDIVMLGLGGGSLVKYCRKHLPDTRLTVVEIDAAVIALRGQFAIPPDDEWLRVVHADAAMHIADMVQAGERTEVLLVDAYDRRGMAHSVTGRQFLEQSRCLLGDTGLFVMNLAAFESDAGRMRAAIRAAFGGPVLSVRVGWGGNTIVFAGPALADAQRLEAVSSRAQQVRAELDLEFQQLPQLVREYLSAGPAAERGVGVRQSQGAESGGVRPS